MEILGTVSANGNRDLAVEVCKKFGRHPHGAVLLRDSGAVLALDCHEELLDIPLAANDTYIVGPHGEMVPFIAKAMRDRAIAARGNRVMHIDAHRDNNEYANSNGFRFNCDSTAIAIRQFLKSIGSNEGICFHNLINLTLGDIETFLAALALYSQEFSAFIRREYQISGDNYESVNPFQYIKAFTRLHLSHHKPEEIIARTKPTIYSLDADVIGVKRERPELSDYVAAEILRQTLDTIFEGMKAEVELQRRESRSENAVFSISMDPRWCTDPQRFLQEFIDRFYLELIRLNTARRSANVMEQG